MYETVYCAKYDLCLKDTSIGALCNDIHTLIEKSEHQSQQLEVQSMQLEVQSQLSRSSLQKWKCYLIF